MLLGFAAMQRWSSIVLGLVFATGIVVLAVSARPKRVAIAEAGAQLSASATESAPESPAPADLPAPAASMELADPGDSVEEPSASQLPAGAPKAVRFGVVLVTYSGAQGAPSSARSKEDALKLAKELVEVAREDFDKAVKSGDKGSVGNAGRIPRGVLEPSIELALFTLEKGKVHESPLDTPRGFWVIKRTE
ncbi:MAG: peptidylprolyl isomerase [Polyangiaceae bacterium]